MNEELDDILARPPGSLLRWGISLLFGLVLLILAGTWFIRYPEVIKGTIIVGSEQSQSPMQVKKPTVDSFSKEHFIGEATFNITYISKLQIGQQVLIRLHAFPYQEYGVWRGVVREITPATNSSQCLAIIMLTDGFQLRQRLQKLPFRPALTGNVELIVSDVRLIERLVYGLVNP